MLWTSKPEFAKALAKKREHPKLPKVEANERVYFTSDLKEALSNVDAIVERLPQPVSARCLNRSSPLKMSIARSS